MKLIEKRDAIRELKQNGADIKITVPEIAKLNHRQANAILLEQDKLPEPTIDDKPLIDFYYTIADGKFLNMEDHELRSIVLQLNKLNYCHSTMEGLLNMERQELIRGIAHFTRSINDLIAKNIDDHMKAIYG